jgi:hypothetical protein
MSTNTRLSAKDAGNLGLTIQECEEHIKVLLKSIDEKIILHPSIIGRNILEYTLPVVFAKNISSTNHKKMSDMKIYIYGAIVKSLIDREFEVRIFVNDKENILLIAWESSFNHTEFEESKKTLQKIMIKTLDEYENFKSSS